MKSAARVNPVRCLALLGVAALLGGCAARAPSPDGWVSSEAVAAAPVAEARITLVSTEHGFVVLEFQGTTIPPAGTALDVYRGDQRVGQVRVTEPARGAFTSADILSGELQIGDHARPGGS